jgi:hypothetical protein
LRQLLVEDAIEYRDVAKFDPRVFIHVLGDKNTPRGAPFIKVASAGLQYLGWSDEQREYFSYLFPGLCDPRTVGYLLLLE